MNREETIKRFNELKQLNLPKYGYEDFKKYFPNNLTDEQIKCIDEYFNKFAKVEDNKCLLCGDYSYSWGILHGSAYCDSCGWEYRIYHYIEDKNGNQIGNRIEAPLQYHPDCFDIEE